MQIKIITLVSKTPLKVKNGKHSSIGRTVDCGSKGCRFKSFFLPVHIFGIFSFYNYFIYNLRSIYNEYVNIFIIKSYFLINYYFLNELIWQEGLLIDFLQKKFADNWTKNFLIYSAYLFNERLVYDKIIRFYLNLIVWPMHKFFIFEFNNVANTLFITIFFFLVFFFIFFFVYVYLLIV